MQKQEKCKSKTFVDTEKGKNLFIQPSFLFKLYIRIIIKDIQD